MIEFFVYESHRNQHIRYEGRVPVSATTLDANGACECPACGHRFPIQAAGPRLEYTGHCGCCGTKGTAAL